MKQLKDEGHKAYFGGFDKPDSPFIGYEDLEPEWEEGWKDAENEAALDPVLKKVRDDAVLDRTRGRR